MLIRNLQGVFTCEGFVAKSGRRVQASDCNFTRECKGQTIELTLHVQGNLVTIPISADEL